MKKLVQVLVATAMISVVVPAFAQQTSTVQKRAVPAATQLAAPAPSEWNTAPEKTRAQVYQELVHAQKDGQLDYLNRAIYAHH